MAFREIPLISMLLIGGFGLTGCLNSESEYQEMVEQRESLKTQLAAATAENEILNEALNDIKREEESLKILANTARSQIAGANTLAPPTTAPLQPLTGNTPTVSGDGWEWAIPPDALPDNPGQNTQPQTTPSSGGQIYRPRSGDVLSTIAARHNTTVAELVRLNPYLKNRRDYMIWETDEIRLP